MRITILVENSIGQSDLLPEHGLAYWIETGTRNVLFDTGQTPQVFEHNAAALGIDLSSTNTIALSHGHYDHTGGLPATLSQAPQAKVITHPAALQPKYRKRPDGSMKVVGMPEPARAMLQSSTTNLTCTTSTHSITPDVHLTGPVPMRTSFEPQPQNFFLDPQATQPDPLLDDQSMILETAKGIVVLLGCAHRGMINTLLHVQEITRTETLHAVIGGTHLSSATEEHIQATTQALKEFDIHHLITGHCTGERAQEHFAKALPNRTRPLAAGQVLEF